VKKRRLGTFITFSGEIQLNRSEQRVLEIFKCATCGKIVMIAHEGAGQLVCCGRPMTQQKENTVDASTEKHIPVVEKSDAGIMVNVGSVPHPMEDKHFIEWIEVISGPTMYVKGLKPGEKPEGSFPVPLKNVKVRAYCNLHGLWSNKPHRE
jgi:superoxide reductase